MFQQQLYFYIIINNHTFMFKISILLLFFIYLTYQSCTVNQNSQSLIQDQVIKLASIPNGQKYILGNINTTTKLYILKTKGTAYQMGKAYGTLFKAELQDQLSNVFSYYQNQVVDAVAKYIPKFAKKAGTTTISLLKTLLDMNYMITKKYTNPRYYQQINGIADGSGVSKKDLRRVNLISELIKAACTVAGLWGPATSNQHTLHMRSLDWDRNIPISKYPLAVVYHPSEPGLYKHINFAWVGLVGCLTGISQKVSLGEKVWLPPQGTVPMTRYGNPWTYVFRDVLYEAHNLESAINILNNTHRTCAIHIGLASVEDHSFRMFEYAYTTLNVYDDKNYNHYGANHPQRNGVAYFDKHVQPSGDSCVGSILASPVYYGLWNLEPFWRIIGLTHETGDTQLAVFDLQAMVAMISYSEYGTGREAYRRNPIRVELGPLFEDF